MNHSSPQIEFLLTQNEEQRLEIKRLQALLRGPELTAHFPYMEEQILRYLMAISPRRATKNMIIEVVYATDEPAYASNTLESHISKLRAKLNMFGARIQSRRSQGYWITKDAAKIVLERFCQ